MDEQDPALKRLIDRVNAARSGQTALDIRGGGTKSFYGGAPQGDGLDVTELAGISSYDPSELVMTARTGTPLADLEAELGAQGQCLPFEPPRFAPGGTVGGMVAAGLAGPARASAGAARDYVLGVTLLNGRGEVLNFGGQVMKNVAGYDVSRLMAGSLGVLGVICEVSLKVLSLPQATSTSCFDWDEASALQRLASWSRQPLALSASAWYEGRLYVRLAGARAAVRAAREQLGGSPLTAEAAAEWWRSVRDHSHDFFALSAADLQRGECLWRMSVPAITAPLPVPGRRFIEWGGAQRWYRSGALPDEVRAAAVRNGGHATLIRGADKSAGVFTPVSEPLMRIHRALKLAFDPQRIFNPGRLYPDL
jgi:FAD/FMN-containing dehydrogenase